MTTQHLVCSCNVTWNSILPAPPCPYHTVVAHNGFCYCRGHLDPHPFHKPSYIWTEWTTDTLAAPAEEYVGKHRVPEKKD